MRNYTENTMDHGEMLHSNRSQETKVYMEPPKPPEQIRLLHLMCFRTNNGTCTTASPKTKGISTITSNQTVLFFPYLIGEVV